MQKEGGDQQKEPKDSKTVPFVPPPRVLPYVIKDKKGVKESIKGVVQPNHLFYIVRCEDSGCGKMVCEAHTSLTQFRFCYL